MMWPVLSSIGVLEPARHESRALGHQHIDTEHLLPGLVAGQDRQQEGTAA
jgi:Clp amino terminal domain, pathogenicity island component